MGWLGCIEPKTEGRFILVWGAVGRYIDEVGADHLVNASSSERASDQVEVVGSHDRLSATCHAQLAEDAVEVGFHRADGDDQLAGDRAIRVTGDDESQYV